MFGTNHSAAHMNISFYFYHLSVCLLSAMHYVRLCSRSSSILGMVDAPSPGEAFMSAHMERRCVGR